MNLIRRLIEKGYEARRDGIFEKTKHDPEIAHEWFIEKSRLVESLGLHHLLLNNSSNKKDSDIELSNAGGFNKNGDIPPVFLSCLGFDRVIVGTVTHDEYFGNPRPRLWRFPETESLVNYLGLPGVGSQAVAKNLLHFGVNHHVPLTINLMSTPGKFGNDVLKDLRETIFDLREITFVDRWELNISCPNTNCGLGTDARKQYQDNLKKMLETVNACIPWYHKLDVKVSPDLDEYGADSIIEVSKNFKVRNFTTTNTTTKHDSRYIKNSPGKGGASGRAVYEPALKVQKMFEERIGNRYGINACGGIDSVEKLKERISSGKVSDVQIFTGLIYKGPKLIREFREYLAEKK